MEPEMDDEPPQAALADMISSPAPARTFSRTSLNHSLQQAPLPESLLANQAPVSTQNSM